MNKEEIDKKLAQLRNKRRYYQNVCSRSNAYKRERIKYIDSRIKYFLERKKETPKRSWEKYFTPIEVTQ